LYVFSFDLIWYPLDSITPALSASSAHTSYHKDHPDR
jgi:hypothetical protein